jgi:Ran GTPase-activating protein (RanGAP) involved in mRNA processing and transport
MNLLPELKSGDCLMTKSGRKVIVRRVKNTSQGTAYDELVYRLVHLLAHGKEQAGNAVWTREELQQAGCKMA